MIKNILKPKSKKNIINDLNKLNQEEKNQKLRIAFLNGHLDIVKLLIKAGLDVNAKIYGSTLLFWANVRNYKEIIDLLKRYGAK